MHQLRCSLPEQLLVTVDWKLDIARPTWLFTSMKKDAQNPCTEVTKKSAFANRFGRASYTADLTCCELRMLFENFNCGKSSRRAADTSAKYRASSFGLHLVLCLTPNVPVDASRDT